jgi:hypothetical protein
MEEGGCLLHLVTQREEQILKPIPNFLMWILIQNNWVEMIALCGEISKSELFSSSSFSFFFSFPSARGFYFLRNNRENSIRFFNIFCALMNIKLSPCFPISTPVEMGTIFLRLQVTLKAEQPCHMFLYILLSPTILLCTQPITCWM